MSLIALGVLWGQGGRLQARMCVCVRVVCGVCDFICITPCSYDNKVENYRVRRNDKAQVTVDDDEYFDNLIKLVEVSIVNNYKGGHI